jgi:hypothetical protein
MGTVMEEAKRAWAVDVQGGTRVGAARWWELM